jgi:hypothetical protein
MTLGMVTVRVMNFRGENGEYEKEVGKCEDSEAEEEMGMVKAVRLIGKTG